MYNDIFINHNFISAFRNEKDFYNWLIDTEKNHDVLTVIDEIIELLTEMNLEKFVLKALKFKNEN
jgi:hypothetical protein